MIFDKEIVLEDDSVLMRPVEPADIDGFRNIFFDPELWLYTVSKISEENELEAFISDAAANKKNKIRYTFTTIDKGSGEIAGSSSFGNLAEADRCVEIGWTTVARKFWNSGVNTHAKFLMMKYAFEDMGMNRVEYKTDDANPRSGRALIKVGCTKEGVLRSQKRLHNGRMRDTAVYSILVSEWPGIKQKLLSSFQ